MNGPDSGRRSWSDPIVRDSLGVAFATGAYGISMGAIGVASGLDVWQTCATSLLIFTGASQFAMAGVIGAGGAPMSAAAAGLLLASRNMLYGLKLAPLLRFTGWRRAAAAQVLIDESTAMSITRETTAEARTGFLTTGIGIFVLWNLATLIGAVAGDHLGDPRDYGLDSAVGGAFLALLWPRLEERRNQVCALLAVALALSLVPAVPAGYPVLAAAGVALLMGVLR
jgi:4-azaleucine resistance transporter AzlC